MVTHIFPNFLQDERVYAQAEQYWIKLWNEIKLIDREENGWTQPWFQPLPPNLSEGNPIFSAVSLVLRRGIRILQSEPTERGVELFAYPDTFGGTIFDPSAIHELVISCALSDLAGLNAISLMRPWVAGKTITFEMQESGMFLMNRQPSRHHIEGVPRPFAA